MKNNDDIISEVTEIYDGRNLYNRRTSKDHILLNVSTGIEEYSAPNVTSDFIYVGGYTFISLRDMDQFTVNTNYRVYFYTADKVFIQRYVQTTAATCIVTLPTGCVYVRICIPRKSNIDIYDYKYMVCLGSVIINKWYSNYSAIDNVARTKLDNNEKYFNNHLREQDTYNLYNWETTQEYVILNASTGIEEYSAPNDTSDFIPFTGNAISLRDMNHFNVSTTYRVYFYDSSKQYISRLTKITADTCVFSDIPANTAYIRICIPHSATNPIEQSKYVVTNGEVNIIKYMPYYSAIDSYARRLINTRIATPPAMLTIIDDDGHLDYLDYLLPFCREINAPIATAITPLRFGAAGGQGRYMTMEEIKQCHLLGAEVINHTYSHTVALDDIKRIKVIDGRYIDSATFNNSSGSPVEAESDATYHDTNTNKYYTYSSIYSEISSLTMYDYSKLIDVYTDVSGYYDTSGNPIYQIKDEYFIYKLRKYYNTTKNIMAQMGLIDGDILVYNNSTGNDPVAVKAARDFRCAFTLNGGINYFNNLTKHQLKRYSIDSATFKYDVDKLKALIDKNITEGGWMVWCMHTTGHEWRGDNYDGNVGIGKDAVLSNLKEAINYAHNVGLRIVTASYGCKAYIDGSY